MTQILTCSYCDKDYFDFNIYINQVERLMCIDCFREDVPMLSDKKANA